MMVALDIDGTLHIAPDSDANAHKTMSAAVRASVHNVVASGSHVVLCAGRLSPAAVPFVVCQEDGTSVS